MKALLILIALFSAEVYADLDYYRCSVYGEGREYSLKIDHDRDEEMNLFVEYELYQRLCTKHNDVSEEVKAGATYEISFGEYIFCSAGGGNPGRVERFLQNNTHEIGFGVYLRKGEAMLADYEKMGITVGSWERSRRVQERRMKRVLKRVFNKMMNLAETEE